jgi:hypothetical protein
MVPWFRHSGSMAHHSDQGIEENACRTKEK